MTNTDPFRAPGTAEGDHINWDEVNGTLLLFTIYGIERNKQTIHGVSDAVKADVVALDGADKGKIWHDILVFPKVLRSQLSSDVGGMVLGRLEQGAKQPGKNPPWQLADPTEADREVGRKYLAHVAAQAPAPADAPF